MTLSRLFFPTREEPFLKLLPLGCIILISAFNNRHGRYRLTGVDGYGIFHLFPAQSALFILLFIHYYDAMHSFLTTSSLQTKELGVLLAKELRGGEIICLSGDLGAGKTTFAQGLLESLGAEGPFTSPTFNIIKAYQVPCLKIHQDNSGPRVKDGGSYTIYHIDTYRITSEDLIALDFKNFAGKPNSITILEWPENVADILPENSLLITFEWIDENQRKISVSAFSIKK
jgi:tRNA threonylcarbamoyladenosine biosynthesis protein TsaE